ncbi:U-box domain-containing protein 33 [Phtheirospermum japonicum]|uniref:RING-type E3 ubiquitin transferase n=1 Tax=Phtheirospermum japonicum TaxID=374723 RepID=A0A830BDD1_9LAMI|nr:U-box domain-containing protein 33 [Phtheirospermum japonicum]
MAALLTHPHRPIEDFHSGFSPASMGGVDAVHVAVGKSAEKTMALLQWTVSTFPGHQIVLLHVHRPSPFIPTPLGKLPASRANPGMLAAFRQEERDEAMKVLSTYLTTCSRSRVKASIITTETDEVHKGIVDLVNLHTIRKLAFGATPESAMLRNTLHLTFLTSTCDPLDSRSASSKADIISGSEYAAPRLSSASRAKTVEECLRIQLAELKREADESRDEANLSLVDRKISEDRALEAFNKVKALEAAHSREEKLRIDAEATLRTMIQGQEKLVEESEKISQQMQRTMRNIALLDSRAQEADRRCEEVSEELQLIEASVSTLRNEKQKLQGKKNEATRWLDRWRNHEKCEDVRESKAVGSKENSCEVLELLVSDVETATCDFCESLRIGHGEYGTVYKGEMSGKTVAIKKLHARHGITKRRIVSKVRKAISMGKTASILGFIRRGLVDVCGSEIVGAGIAVLCAVFFLVPDSSRGRETSPMTNLKLSHLDLTPNYSLRLAIQDWAANLEIAD